MRLFAAIAGLSVLLATASPASARCYTAPDTASTGYVGRSVGRTICLQDELSQTQQQQQLQTSIQTQITNMQQQMQQQKFDNMMRNGF